MITKELKFKYALLSNFDIIDWEKYLKDPIKGIFSHNEIKLIFITLVSNKARLAEKCEIVYAMLEAEAHSFHCFQARLKAK